MCLSEAAAREVMKSKYLQVWREILQSQAVPAAVLSLHHNHLLQVPRQGLLAEKKRPKRTHRVSYTVHIKMERYKCCSPITAELL